MTAKTIAQAYERFVYPSVSVDTVVIGGGGAYNKTMMKFLRQYLPKRIELKTHEDFGISNNIPSCTGASKRVVLGKLTEVG